MPQGVTLAPRALDHLMPMHLCLDAAGKITSAGPTLKKIAATPTLIGAAFFDLFEIRRPGGLTTLPALHSHGGQRLFLNRRNAPDTNLRGIAVPLQQTKGGLLLNLSFGIELADAVARHTLTDSDFAATDLAVEMLYLLEAKTSVMAELHNLNTRLQEARLRAEEQALTDALTGLRNRRAMDTHLTDLIARRLDFGLMHIDLDLFKQVNDQWGHAAGDHVLIHVAQNLRAICRKEDLIARVGGDEFVIVFTSLTDIVRLTNIAQRIITRLCAPIDYEGRTCHISASIGITLSTLYDTLRADRLLSDADRALYAAKNAGRGRVTVHSP